VIVHGPTIWPMDCEKRERVICNEGWKVNEFLNVLVSWFDMEMFFEN
jgi:hypothetical protein